MPRILQMRNVSGSFASPSLALSGMRRTWSSLYRPPSAGAGGVFETNVRITSSTDKLFESDRRPIILFDGVCNLCNGGVNLALDLDPPGKLRFAALQSDAGRALLRRAGRDPDDISSIVLVEERDSYVKSDAVLRIARYLDNPALPAAAALGMLFPGVLRDVVYDIVADNRYSLLGMRDECRLGDARFDDRFVADDAV